jgi:hypothetical protein
MPRVMVTLRLDPGQATLPEVRELLGPAPEEVDPAFGLVNIGPAEHLSTILVDEPAATRVADARRSRACSPTPGSSRSAPQRRTAERQASPPPFGGGALLGG